MDVTLERLQQMREIDIYEVGKEQLIDMDKIQIDKKQTVKNRIKGYLKQTGNPFFVKSGKYILKFEYSDCDKDISDCMIEYISKATQIHD